MRRLILSLLAISGLVWAGGCKKGQENQSQVLLGEYESLSGAEASFGQSSHKGIMLAVDEINGSGGVLGKQIKVITEDDAGSQDQAVTVVKKLVNQDNVSAVLGEVASSNSLAGGGVCQQAKVPMVSPSSTNPNVTMGRDYVFRVCFTDDFQGAADARFAISKGWKNVATLTCEDSDYSKSLDKFFETTFSKSGKIVAKETYSKADKDYKTQLTKIAAAKPDAIYIPGYYTNVGLILRQAREDTGIKAPLFGGDGWDGPDVLKLGALADGCFFSNHYSADDPSPRVQDFIKAYKAKYNNETPDAMAITGYDAAKVMADAIRRAGSTDPTAIRDALAKTKDFSGAGGIITIDANRNARKPIYVVEIRGGKTHLVDTIQPE